MTIAQWVGRAVPDLSTTLRRFPLPVILAALATAIVLYQTVAKPFSGGDFWFELTYSAIIAATLAVGGALFRESRPDNRLVGAGLAYVVPLLALALPQLLDSTWYV